MRISTASYHLAYPSSAEVDLGFQSRQCNSREFQRRVFKNRWLATIADAVMVEEERDPELTDDQIFIDDFLPRLTFSEEKATENEPPVSISSG